MEHHNDIGVQTQRFRVTGFLIAAVSEIPFMLKHAKAQPARNLDGFVVAEIVHEQDRVDNALGNLSDSPLQCPRGIVSREDDCDAVTV
jgi:hypothetical protein